MTKLTTGIKDFDKLFSYDSDLLTMIYGEPATGKTTWALLKTISEAKEKKVIYIDTENGFSVERLKQLAPDYKSFSENIMHIHPGNLEEQEKIILNLNEKIKVVIIDTIGFFYRVEVKHDPYKTNKSLDNQLKKLHELSKKGVFILMTSQVYSNLNGKIINVGGDMLKNWSKMIVSLSKNPRKLKIEKPFELEALFEIEEKGIKICI